MIRLLLGNTIVAAFMSAPGASRSSRTSAMDTLNASAQSRHFSTASKLWRSEGDAISTSVRSCVPAIFTARPAPVKLLPVWRPAITAMNRAGSS